MLNTLRKSFGSALAALILLALAHSAHALPLTNASIISPFGGAQRYDGPTLGGKR